MTAAVYLIGAGPGDPGLLTLRGAELLSKCDVVLYDGLSNDAILSHAPQAELICVGKHGQSRIWSQEEICAEILRHARLGRRVARLKGGDPAVFARTAEEVDAVRAAGLPFEIVPGITAALAAGSYAGIPITHRALSSAVALVTGHEEPSKSESALDWDALARFPGTLVIYMGVTTAPQWTSALIGAGKPGSTPVAIVRRCSHSDQQTVHCRLDEVAERLTPASRMRPPVIVIIGQVTRLAETMSWFDQRPLFGKTILVTRPIDQAESLAEPLRELGATTLTQPLIKISPPSDWTEVDQSLARLNEWTTIVFTSANGVHHFMQRLLEKGWDGRALASLRIAVVGSQTNEAFKDYCLRADVVPEDFCAESLATTLLTDASEHRFLLVQASRARDTLFQQLSPVASQVDRLVIYDHTDVTEPDSSIAKWVAERKVDWVTVTSSQSARNLVRMFGDHLRHLKIASLSPVTSRTLEELGFVANVEAKPYTMQALADAIANAEMGRQS